MPLKTMEPVSLESERSELQTVLESQLFSRAPTLAHLLSYLCEKAFAGESGQIKEYSIAVDVFGRNPSFDQDTDSIVRVQANRLRKRLAEYYSGEGAAHRIHITIPIGQYVPAFEQRPEPPAPSAPAAPPPSTSPTARRFSTRKIWLVVGALLVLAIGGILLVRKMQTGTLVSVPTYRPQAVPEPAVGLPVGDEIRILAGATRSYVDRSGKLWNPDTYFAGGTTVRSPIQHIWRTQDPTIYRSSRQGDFTYDIPLKPGTYDLHLHFAETFYGPEDAGGGGEGSRVMKITVNGEPLLTDFDVIADSEGGRTADVKVFSDISPASDGKLHIGVSSMKGGRGMLSAIEILPGMHGRIRPVRIVAREVPYYSNDSHWWSSDVYFKGGQLAASEEPATGTDDPELYETERWGHFSYSIPVIPGRYTVVLHFIERRFDTANRDKLLGAGSEPQPESEGRLFTVFCNGKAILSNLNIVEEAGENRPLVRKITGLQPNAQGKLFLDFVPIKHYATVSAIEVVPQ